MKQLLTFSLMMLFAGSLFAQDDKPADKPKEDRAKQVLANAQGKWEVMLKSGNEEIRSVKEIKGNKETVSRYRGDELLHQWTVDFDITHEDGFNTFTYRNMTFTHGPNKGRVVSEPRSYLFRIYYDRWYEIHGLREGQTGVPEITIYKRDSAKKSE